MEKESVINIFNSNFLTEGIKCLRHLLRQAEVMSEKYDVTITNPPYIKLSKIDGFAKTYLQNNYENSYADMYTMFMDTAYTKRNGYIAIVNPDSWMLENSFENFREYVLKGKTITTLLSLPLGEMDSTVLTVAFVLKNSFYESYISKCIKKDNDLFNDYSKFESRLYSLFYSSKILLLD